MVTKRKHNIRNYVFVWVQMAQLKYKLNANYGI